MLNFQKKGINAAFQASSPMPTTEKAMTMSNSAHTSQAATPDAPRHHRLRFLRMGLHISVLAASVIMIVWITHDTIEAISFLSNPGYLHFQFWVCMLFLLDIIVDWIFSPKKWKYLASHILFILVSIPYLNIVEWMGIHPTPLVSGLLRYIPMIRAGYVLAIISGVLSASKVMTVCYVYVIWVLTSLYFASLVFFVEEHAINPDVGTFWTALYWGATSMTSVGSNIEALTATGRALGVLLAGEGLTLFPVFTVYITDAVISNQPSGSTSGASGSTTNESNETQNG